MKFKIDRFVLAIFITVLIAYLFPYFATDKSPLNITIISNIGISVIFLFYGLKLNKKEIKDGLYNWKLHLLVQFTTFLLFPIFVLLLNPFIANDTIYQNIWLAFFFLACLPSTVSSSVVMVSLAKGNVTGAIFNASLSGILGIVLTPLWMGLFLNNKFEKFDFTQTYIDLILQIILPVVIGLFLQKYIGFLALKFSKQLSLFDKSIILLIIYKSFSTAFSTGLFKDVSIIILLGIFIGVVVLFIIMYGIVNLISSKLNFNQADKITALFCGTKKSLVHGTVFSSVMFKTSSILGFILLPIMIYHAFQIIVISFIAQKYTPKV